MYFHNKKEYIPKSMAPTLAHALVTSRQRWQLKFSWIRRFESRCMGKATVFKRQTIHKLNSFTYSNSLGEKEKTIFKAMRSGLTNFRRLCKLSKRSLTSSMLLQFSIKDHNQAFGAIVRLTFTDSRILS